MKRIFAGLLIISTIGTGAAFAEAQRSAVPIIEELRQANPFEITEQLHQFTYAELHDIYPALSEREMTALMWHIVNSMKGLE